MHNRLTNKCIYRQFSILPSAFTKSTKEWIDSEIIEPNTTAEPKRTKEWIFVRANVRQPSLGVRSVQRQTKPSTEDKDKNELYLIFF